MSVMSRLYSARTNIRVGDKSTVKNKDTAVPVRSHLHHLHKHKSPWKSVICLFVLIFLLTAKDSAHD